VVLPGVLLTLVALWPFIEARVTGDRGEHHLLDRPWEAPGRTATGVAILSVFLIQTIAGGNDVLAVLLNVQVETLTLLLQILLVTLPVALWLLTYRLCRERARRGHDQRPRPGGVLVRRTAAGGFEEVEP
jgi:ubiquinol-cytochrome c reductase cytochrome b subunit